MVIKFSVREQTISLLPTKSIPRIGSKDYLILQFVFSNDWDSLSKVVYLQKDSVSEPIELVGDTLKVPEWFTEQDTFNVTLLGVGDTQEVPTNVVSIKLEKSNTLWNEDAPIPQPSWLVTVLEATKRVEEAVVNPPKIGENGNWFVWDFDAGKYVDTGVAASGGGGGGVTDVQVAGNSAVSDGVAIIPRASSSEYGVIKPITVYATEVNNNGALIASVRTAENYDSLPSAGFISKGTLENINNRLVKAAMCDGKGPAWTAEEQAAARDRMGIPGDYQLIEEIVLEETVSEISRNICPDGEAYQFEHFAVKLDIPAVESGVITQRTFGMDVNGKRIFWLNNVVAETGCYSFTFFVTSLHGMCVAFCVGGTVSNNYAAWNIYPTCSYFHLFSLPVTDFKLHYGTFPAGTNVKIYGVEA